MSDYVFSSIRQPEGALSSQLKGIYKEATPQAFEYHGDWGSVAVTKQHYYGFLPFENEQHIFIVLGAPVLYFADNKFLTAEDTNQATQKIYQRFVQEDQMYWQDDISGPFTVLLINKQTRGIKVVTDLMSFIPVYSKQNAQGLWVGTHVDALAKACGEQNNIDEISIADFILNDVVTFPHTVYKNIKQLAPGSIYNSKGTALEQTIYWQPKEDFYFSNINQAASELRNGITKYVNTIVDNTESIAQFISAGEDSRALSGILPQHKKRDAYIFLDAMNREGEIAKKVADAYGANFNVGLRSKTHYLEILPEASALVGAGHQYSHAHSLGFDKKYKLANYSAVFGGYLSDSLLKGEYVPKSQRVGRFPFIPSVEVNRSPVGSKFSVYSDFMRGEYLNGIKERQQAHFEFIKGIRPTTSNEWFVLYPASMRVAIPNFYSTRRLFKSYEPFLSHESVKMAASVPTSWKLNRRLFNKAMKPFLKPSKWIQHADGRYPYFSFITNMPIQFTVWAYRQFARRLGFIKGNQGPWGEWNAVFSSPQWQQQLKEFSVTSDLNFFTQDLENLVNVNQLTSSQKVNLMQILWFLDDRSKHRL